MAPSRSNSDFLLRALVHAAYWIDESLQNKLEAAGWGRVSRAKSMIMVNISDGVDRPVDLARNLGVSRQAIHQTLAEMEQDGLIELTPDPKDGRAKIVRFSHNAIGIRDDALKSLRHIEKQLASRIGEQDVKSLIRILSKDWGEPIGSRDKLDMARRG